LGNQQETSQGLGSSETVRAAPEIGEDTVQTTTEQGLGNQEW